jgi:hypothetical protein
MGADRTTSESLFEAFCAEHDVPCAPIPRERGRTADYRLTLGVREVIAEVKQLDPGPADLDISRALAATGRAAVVLVPGARVRQEITDSRKQLRAQAKGRHPAMLVLYDNTGGRTGMIAPHDVLVAMYGEERVEFEVVREPSANKPHFRFVTGGNRGVDQAANTTLSAVAVLSGGVGYAALRVYHNCYAALPIDPESLRGPRVHHFAVTLPREGAFRDWYPL